MPSPHAALIVDADPQGLESLVYGFQGAEWRMTACPSPETAVLLVKASGARLVVMASRAEHEKTLSLVRQLRTKEESRALPILVLGPEELRPQLENEGEAELLPLPAFVRDVLTASELLVAAAAAHRPQEEPCWRGPVTSSRILSLVRTMNGLGRSGQLRLERSGRTGEILFHHGELTAASIGALQGTAALQHLMVWNDGKLELRLRQVPRRGQLAMTAQEFLQEMDRFQRDFAHAMKEIGPPTAVYSASQERLKQAAGAVPAEVTPVVRLCNGSRTLSDLIDESPFRVLDTVRILGRLAELGVLIRSDGKPLAPPGDERLDQARIEGPSAPAAWPMPAPIGGFPLSTPILRTPVPPSQPAKPEEQVTPPPPRLEDQVTPPPVRPEDQVTPPPLRPEEQVTPPPAVQTASPAAAGRPRRQTREIAIAPPPSTAPPTEKTPRPVVVVGGPAAKTPKPVASSRGAGKTPKPVVVVGRPAEKTPRPVAVGRPAEKTPRPVIVGRPAEKTPRPVIVGRPAEKTPRPVVIVAPHAAPAAPLSTATILQAAGALRTHPPAGHGQGTPPPAEKTPTVAPRVPPESTASPPGVMQAAGVIDSGKHTRRSQQTQRAAAPRPSVVIEAIASEEVRTPTLKATAASPAEAPPAGPPAAARRSTPVMGTLEAKPSRRSAVQAVPVIHSSIQVDASLSAPATPEAAPPPAAARPEPPGSRMTGELHVPPSGRSTRSMDKAASKPSSFHIDPSLSGDMPAVAKPAQPGHPGSQPAAAQKRTDSRPIPRGRTDSQPIPGSSRHQSGSFSTVEKDFFDREADLYKQEKVESFADLDEGQAKPAPKPKGGKPGRPYRK